jgi:hypothetical protein
MRFTSFLLLIFLFPLLGCDEDKYTFRIIVYALIAIIGGYFSKQRNKRVQSEDIEMIEELKKNESIEINNPTDNTINQNIELISNKISESNEGQIINGNSDYTKGNFIGKYEYSTKILIIILLLSLFFLFIGFMGNEYRVSFIPGGILLGFWIFLTIFLKFRKRNPHFTYELYENQIDVYRNNNEFIYSIKWSDIVDIDVDYRTSHTRFGEQIDRIIYKIRVKNIEALREIDVHNYVNKSTGLKLKDDFKKVLLEAKNLK